MHNIALGLAPSEPAVGILFTVSALRATLTADTLELAGVAAVVMFYTNDGQAGIYTTNAAASRMRFHPAVQMCLPTLLPVCQWAPLHHCLSANVHPCTTEGMLTTNAPATC